MIENEEVKSGELLCIQDEMIKFFMIDRNVIKRDSASSWKVANIVPTGFFNQRAYYRILNKNLEEKNVTLKNSLKDSSKNSEDIQTSKHRKDPHKRHNRLYSGYRRTHRC